MATAAAVGTLTVDAMTQTLTSAAQRACWLASRQIELLDDANRSGLSIFTQYQFNVNGSLDLRRDDGYTE